MGAVVREFEQTYGTSDTVWIVPFPHWVDTRLPAVWAGIPNRDMAIWRDKLPETLGELVRGWNLTCGVECARAHAKYYPARKAEYGPVLAALIERGLAATRVEYQALEQVRAAFRTELDELLAPYKRNRGLTGEFDTPLGLFLQAAPARDVLARIHTHPSHRLDELLPHRWRPA